MKFWIKNNDFIRYSWQDLLDNTGINQDIISDIYNYLSWYAHSSAISLYQLRNIY